MTATLLVGDIHQRQTELIATGQKFDLVITSPPFLALRSYLPDGHPLKHLEIGSEQTPADYLDVLLALTAEWRQLLAPHGSIAVELGDTYAGSGGAGGDYNPDGLRDGQERFDGSQRRRRLHPDKKGHSNLGDSPVEPRYNRSDNGGDGWPMDKSLSMIPTLYPACLAYGRNLLTGQPSPAGRWRIRNLKPWIRSNPPVGRPGDKERPATSYITVATLARDRWFDLDAVRTPLVVPDAATPEGARPVTVGMGAGKNATDRFNVGKPAPSNPGGAPPLDWWHQTDAVIDDELRQRAGKPSPGGNGKGRHRRLHGGQDSDGAIEGEAQSIGARGWHIRRRLEAAGILPSHPDALDISPRGYSGAHYAVWPPELVRQLVDEMCPRKVCVTCGEPSRRLTEASYEAHGDPAKQNSEHKAQADHRGGRIYDGEQRHQNAQGMAHGRATKNTTTVGWSDCGHSNDQICVCGHDRDAHETDGGECQVTAWFGWEGDPDYTCPCIHFKKGDHWRPGRILDPFSGSGTTLAVATGMGRDAVGIDLDSRNAHLTEQRCGMFISIDWGDLEPTDELPPDEIVAAVGDLL